MNVYTQQGEEGSGSTKNDAQKLFDVLHAADLSLLPFACEKYNWDYSFA